MGGGDEGEVFLGEEFGRGVEGVEGVDERFTSAGRGLWCGDGHVDDKVWDRDVVEWQIRRR